MARILMPLPARDFDPTEVGVSWRVLRARGHRVTFATPDRRVAAADALMVTDEGFDLWGEVPGLRQVVLVGRLLRADANGRAAYSRLCAAEEFRAPIGWDAVDGEEFDGIVLAGGHRARGMRAYLESPVLQQVVARFFATGRPVGAICHGVLLAARSRGADGRSVLFGRRTTGLTWRLERTGNAIGNVVRWWDRDYYRTYREARGQERGFMSVEAEVKRSLADPADFLDARPDAPDGRRKLSGRHRDTPDDARPAFVVRDGTYVSARWPGDAHSFAARFAELLEG